MIDTIGIPIAFVIFSVMSLWIIIGCKGFWTIKAAFIVISMYFSACLWTSLDGLQGWPTQQTPPQEFEIKWILAKEPNIRTEDPGSIYIWLVNLHPDKTAEENSGIIPLHNKVELNEPRIYKFPYSESLRNQGIGIRKRIADGERVRVRMGEKSDGKGKGEGKGRGKGDGKGKGKGDGSLSQKQKIIFHDLPPPVFPKKILKEE